MDKGDLAIAVAEGIRIAPDEEDDERRDQRRANEEDDPAAAARRWRPAVVIRIVSVRVRAVHHVDRAGA